MRKIFVFASVGALTLTAVSAVAYAQGPIPVAVGSGSAECSLTWSKPGITLSSPSPASDITGPSTAFTDATGQLLINADPASLTTPSALASAITLAASGTGGFTFTNALGTKVDVSAPDAALPQGQVTFVVKTPTMPQGVRMPAFEYSIPTNFAPELTSLLPLQVKVHVDGLTSKLTPGFATVLNNTFGPGTATGGDVLGTCSADVTAA
ncbi:hypothetical protein [Streptomyces sp. I05A-00742]|uniref:hypothetical protein n=1 Tax=Streptomyces sp. I05A-00742 TaxID=2732853 RepID=UPI0014884095|nr:hypothetical protein [Streptomyces sp. I05A-00742]